MGNRLSAIATLRATAVPRASGDGSRASKADARVAAMGDVDELNSAVGMLVTQGLPETELAMGRLLAEVQQDLLGLGGELSIPGYTLLQNERRCAGCLAGAGQCGIAPASGVHPSRRNRGRRTCPCVSHGVPARRAQRRRAGREPGGEQQRAPVPEPPFRPDVRDTMRLVDDLDEQALLEQILENSKPPAPTVGKHQHFLLWTPFRYRSPVASRFRRGGEAGVWYGAEELATACSELAYWRWRFLVDSDGLVDSEIVVELTFFQARTSGSVLDLCAPPWVARHSAWRHPDDQRLAQACRERGDVSWIQYASARRIDGICAAVLEPTCLRMNSTRSQQTWSCKVTRSTVLMAHDNDRLSMHFDVAAGAA